MKKFYSQRNNSVKKKWNLTQVLELFYSFYEDLGKKDYFSENFGYVGEWDNFYGGKLGSSEKSVEMKVFRLTKKDNLYPIEKFYQNYTEEDLFDVIELLHEYCTINKNVISSDDRYYYQSKIEQTLEYQNFQLTAEEYFSFYLKQTAQSEFRNEINEILVDYEDGFILNENGQIESLKLDGLEQIINAKLPKIEGKAGEIIEQKVENAVKIFRRKGGIIEKQNGLKQLADILEHFKKDYEVKILSKDENDLFQIANEFEIRHLNKKQKSDYPEKLYYSWIFHVYLATIHLWLGLILDKKAVKIEETK